MLAKINETITGVKCKDMFSALYVRLTQPTSESERAHGFTQSFVLKQKICLLDSEYIAIIKKNHP